MIREKITGKNSVTSISLMFHLLPTHNMFFLSKGLKICPSGKYFFFFFFFEKLPECSRNTNLVNFNEIIKSVNFISEGSSLYFTRVVQQVHREKLSFPSRITPCANARFLCDPCFYRPPDGKKTDQYFCAAQPILWNVFSVKENKIGPWDLSYLAKYCS